MERTDWAHERTDWAHERTLMAKERTFAAWSRTGVACLAAGLAIARLIEVADHTWIVRAIGLSLIATALFVFTVGFLSYRKTVRKLEAEGIRGMPLWAIGALTIGLMLSAVIGVLLIFQE